MAYERLNLIDDDVLKAEHISHMEGGIERANSVLVETAGDTLTWDGNTEGLEILEDVYIKVPAVTLPRGYLEAGGSIRFSASAESGLPEYSTWTPEDVSDFDGAIIKVMPYPFSVAQIAPVLIVPEAVTADGVTLDEGVYFLSIPMSETERAYTSEFTINGYTGFINEQLDKKYLPMDYITEAVISKLPIYNGEVV